MKVFIFVCVYMYIFNFNKKLIPLLSLEFMMISLIFSFYYSLKENPFSCFSFFILFLVIMVLDSVLGLSLLVSSCRYSSNSSYSFF